METLDIKIKRFYPDARIPTYGTLHSAGVDVYCCNDVRFLPNETLKVRTGIAVEIPIGWELQVRPRSGLATRGVSIVNTPGTIDADYRGEICVIMHSKAALDLPAGTRIAQLVPSHVPQINFIEVNELSDTERGDGGFGSTG